MCNDKRNETNETDNVFYDKLSEISNLFKEKNFKAKVGSKLSNDSVYQTIIYFNPINETEQYVLHIISKNLLNIKIPIKNSNSCFTTIVKDINSLYELIKTHLK